MNDALRMIDVLYSCSDCGIEKALAPVRERRENEDVVFWVGVIVAAVISDDHHARSPKCPAETIEEVMIPFPPGSELGRLPLPN